MTAAYVSGTVIGGVTGRLLGGVVANDVSWSSSFVVLGVIGLVAAGALWLWLPPEQRRGHSSRPGGGSWRSHLQHRQLLATYAVGFCMLCTQLAMFTYVPFLLAAPPFSLSTSALGLLFLTYVVGAIMTPFAGRGIDAYGHRAVLVGALALCASGALLTLVPSLSVVAAGPVDLCDGRLLRASGIEQPCRASRRTRSRTRHRPLRELLLRRRSRRWIRSRGVLGGGRLAGVCGLHHQRRDRDAGDCVALLDANERRDGRFAISDFRLAGGAR